MKRKVIYFWKKEGARGSDWKKKRLNKGKDKSTDCWLKIKKTTTTKQTKNNEKFLHRKKWYCQSFMLSLICGKEIHYNILRLSVLFLFSLSVLTSDVEII